MVQHRDLPQLALGDVLAVMDAGAYFIPNQMNFSRQTKDERSPVFFAA